MVEFFAPVVKFLALMAEARNLVVEKCDFKILWKENSVCIFAKCDGVNEWNKTMVIIICEMNKAKGAARKKLL